jgi:hypothetical protein
MTYRSAIHNHRHPHGEDDSYGDNQDRDGHWYVRNRMIHRFLLNQSVAKAGQGLPTDRLYGIASAQAICPGADIAVLDW